MEPLFIGFFKFLTIKFSVSFAIKIKWLQSSFRPRQTVNFVQDIATDSNKVLHEFVPYYLKSSKAVVNQL